MTISSSTNKAGPFTTPGTGPFAFTFKTFADEDIQAIHVTAAGAETTLELTTDYLVTLNADQEADPGGEVLLVSALLSGESLYVLRVVQPTQTLQLVTGGNFSAERIMDALDRQAMVSQQLTEEVARSLKATVGSGGDPDSLIEGIEASEAASAGHAATATAAMVAAGISAATAQAFAESIDPDLLAHIDESGINSDITEIAGLTTPLTADQGGTGAATLAAAIQAMLDTISTTTGVALYYDGDNWSAQALSGYAVSGSLSSLGDYLFTNIPSDAKRVDVTFRGVSTNGTDFPVLRPMGATEAVQTAIAGGTYRYGGTGPTHADVDGVNMFIGAAAAYVFSGAVSFFREGASNTWAYNGSVARTDAADYGVVAGGVVMTEALTKMKVDIVTAAGAASANTFDAGEVTVRWWR